MNMRNVTTAIICALYVTGSLVATAQEVKVIHQSSAEVHNVVSQYMAVARSGDAGALHKARSALAQNVVELGVEIHRHITIEEAFVLRLEILKVACELLAKPIDYDPEKIWQGPPGRIPWPPDEERPEHLRGEPLWWPGTDPDGYKEKNPELYAYYKPLYEEYLKNSRKHSQQRRLQAARRDLIRDIRMFLGMSFSPQFRNADQRYIQCREVVNKLIQDEQLRKELFAEEPPE